MNRDWLTSLLAIGFFLTLSLGSAGQGAPIHHGNLEVSGAQVVTIDDEVYQIDGDIIVKDDAHLTIRSSHLVVGQAYDGEFRILVQDSASLELIDTRISASGGVHIDCFGSAKLKMNGVQGDPTVVTVWLYGRSSTIIEHSTVTSVDIHDTASAELNSSRVEWFVRPSIHGGGPVVFSHLGRGQIASWDLARDIQGVLPFHLRITDSDIGGWAFIIGGTADVTVSESTIDGLVVHLTDAHGELGDLRPGYEEEWSLATYEIGGEIPTIDLRETLVEAWWGVMLEGRCSLILSDSLLSLTLLQGSQSELSLVDCEVRQLFALRTRCSFRSTRSSFRGYMLLDGSSLLADAGARFETGTEVGAWNQSTIERVVRVRVQDRHGGALPGVSVQIWDASAKEVSHGTTDSDGAVLVSLRFADVSWQEGFTVVLPEGNVRVAVGLFSDSSITITLP